MNIVDKIKKLVHEKIGELNTFDIGKITDANNLRLRYNVKLKHKIGGNEIELFNVPIAPFWFNAGMILISLDIDDIVGIAFSNYELKQQLKNKDITDVNEVLKFDMNNAIIVSGAFTDVDEIPSEFENGAILIKHKDGNYIKITSDDIITEHKSGAYIKINVSGEIAIHGSKVDITKL